MTDAFLRQGGQLKFSWGRENLMNASETRKRYINALQQADQYDYGELLNFVRS
jgi:hypothetical protein